MKNSSLFNLGSNDLIIRTKVYLEGVFQIRSRSAPLGPRKRLTILPLIATEQNAVVVTVLHENPNSEYGKTRGHLGSQLERKAESNLRLQKDNTTGVTTIFTEKSRH